MIGVYFSGTGNTQYCIEKLISIYDKNSPVFSIEENSVTEAIKQHQEIVFAYPVYYSNLPKIVRDFIIINQAIWDGKKIFLIATMGLFSGDGTGLASRLLKKYGAHITGGLHLKMPDCICDVKALKRSESRNREMISSATDKLIKAAYRLKQKNPPQEGLHIWNHVAGLLGQRLWFYNKTRSYTDQLHIDRNACSGCGKCATLCPMKNLSIVDHKAQAQAWCTMCYRCINNCPQKAITLIGKTVVEQHSVNDFI